MGSRISGYGGASVTNKIEEIMLMAISTAAYYHYCNSYKPYSPQLIKWMNILYAKSMAMSMRPQ